MQHETPVTPLQPVGYASGGFVRRRRDPLVVAVIVLNFCIAVLSILFSGIFGLQSFSEVARAHHDAVMFQQGYARRAAAYAAASSTPAWTPAVPRIPATAPSRFRGLTPAEIFSDLDLIQRRLDSSHPSPAQIRTLTKLLSANPQNIIDPNIPFGSEISGHLQIVRPILSDDGTLTLTINRGSPGNFSRTRIDSAGNELAAPFLSATLPSEPPILLYAPPLAQPAPILQTYSDQARAAMWSAARYGANLFLDLLLLVAAVFLLNSSRKGVGLLWIYVAVKLIIVAVEGTPLLDMICGSTIYDNPIGKIPVILSAIYPTALILVLPQRIFRTPSLAHIPAQSFDSPNSSPPRSWKVVGVFSLIVAIASLLLIGCLLPGVISQVSQAAHEVPRTNMGPMSNDPQTDYQSSLAMTGVLTLMLILGIMLLASAILLLLRKRSGVLPHRIYAVLQIPASLALGGVLMWSVSDSPAGMIFWIFAFPALIGCIYPIVVLITLRQERSRFPQKIDVRPVD